MPPKGKSGKVAPSPKANAKGKGDGKGGDWEAKEAKMRAMQDALADAQAKRGATAAAASKERKARRKKRAKSVWRRSWEKLFGSKEEIKLRKKTKEMLSALMITEEEVRRMKSVFDDVDLDGAGEMDFDEFMEMIGEKRTPFTDAVFTVVDDPNTGIETITQEEIKQMEARDGPGTALKVRGHLSFDDFVQVVCTFCMYSRLDLMLFSFNAFDSDNSGVIDEQEFMQLCIIVNNDEPLYPDNFKLALNSFSENPDGMMSLDEFEELNDKFPIILFPVFRFQDNLTRKVLGRQTWTDIARRVNEERELEAYRKANDGKEPPRSLMDKLSDCFKRQKTSSKRARKPPSARDTAVKRASQNQAMTVSADKSKKRGQGKDAREARGAGGVGKLKMQERKVRTSEADAIANTGTV